MRVLPALVLLIATCTAFPYDEVRSKSTLNDKIIWVCSVSLNVLNITIELYIYVSIVSYVYLNIDSYKHLRQFVQSDSCPCLYHMIKTRRGMFAPHTHLAGLIH